MQRQGWYESDGNITCFYQCGFNLPRVVHRLMNCTDLLNGKRTTSTLNANATPYESKWMNAVEIEEKVHASSDDEKIAENNKKSTQAWKTCNSKKRGKKKKKKENATKEKEKGTWNNKYERLRPLVGEDGIEEMAFKNNACSMKKEKEKPEQKTNMHHVDNFLIKELDVIIKTELGKDTKMHIEKEKENTRKNKDEANKSPLESKASSEEYEYEEYEDDEEDIFTEEDSAASECPSDFEEWMKWNKKRRDLEK